MRTATAKVKSLCVKNDRLTNFAEYRKIGRACIYTAMNIISKKIIIHWMLLEYY